MLWFEEHRPKRFDELASHSETAEILKKYTLETVPNLIFYSQPGHCRRTILYALIAHLYEKTPQLVQKKTTVAVSDNEIEVNYLESDEVIEIDPVFFGHRDRVIVQTIIKDFTETRPILSFFGAKKNSLRILVISSAECLSRDAQEALRRTVEVYSKHFRIFMICKEITKIIEPIRSRFLFVRMRGMLRDELKSVLTSVMTKENQIIPECAFEKIIEKSSGNAKLAICLAEYFATNSDGPKRLKPGSSFSYKLEWEEKIGELAEIIKGGKGPDLYVNIRKAIHIVLNSGIHPKTLLFHLVTELTSSLTSLESIKDIVEAGIKYEERLNLGTKPLYHLEAFAASAVVSLKNNK